MKIDEVISTLKVMRAEVERYYPMDCAAALDEAIKALRYMEFMSNQNNCNDCGWENCRYKPKLGEPVRTNCYRWMAKDKHSMEPEKAESGSITCISGEKTHDRTTNDLINRQEAIQAIRDREDMADSNGAFWEGLIIATGIINDLPANHQDGDCISRSWCLAEYDRQHEGPPGGARKIIEEAPPISPTQMSGTWIPVMDGDGQLPEVDEDGYSLPLLISTQCTIPAVGQYRVDETGGEFYDYDGDEPLSKIGIFVTAWMYLPESYKED